MEPSYQQFFPKTIREWLFSLTDIRLWDIASRHRMCDLRTVCQFTGHQGAVRGLGASSDGSILVSCGTDSTVRLWNVPVATPSYSDDSSNKSMRPLAVHVWKHAFWGVDHQWDHNRSQPVNSFPWGNDSVISIRFNPGEPGVLAASASDCSIILYDLCVSTPTKKLIMRTKTNSISWNPLEPMNFTAANEDCNCYSHDARKLEEAKCVHKDHVPAVMDIDYSPPLVGNL